MAGSTGHDVSDLEAADATFERRTPWSEVVTAFSRDLVGQVGLAGLVIIIAVALVGPVAYPFSPTEQNYDAVTEAPSLAHPLGTDHIGRDTLARLMVGARFSLFIGVGSMLVASLIGISLGSIAGYTARTWVDESIMRFMDVLISFPAIVLGLAVMGTLGTDPVDLGVLEITNIYKLIFVIGLVYTPRFARVTRGAVLKEKNRDYVKLAKLEGASDFQVITREIMINIVSPLVVMFSYRMGSAMIAAAGLSFLGIGVQPPTPSWGVMISNGMDHMSNWWMVVFPGLALAATVMCWNLLGDAFRDALDPNVSALEEQ